MRNFALCLCVGLGVLCSGIMPSAQAEKVAKAASPTITAKQLEGEWRVDARIMTGVIYDYLEKQSPSKTEKAKETKKAMALSLATNSPVKLQFEANNVAKMITGPQTVEGSYAIAANTVTLTFEVQGKKQSSTATLNNGILELAISEEVKNAPFKSMPFAKVKVKAAEPATK